jgi:E3 ubiquitin-protein ligase RNF216
MTCPCGALVCYICRKEIDKQIGYQHFCQLPLCDHKRCKKCVLYSNTQQDDELAMQEAGIKAAEEVREESVTAE